MTADTSYAVATLERERGVVEVEDFPTEALALAHFAAIAGARSSDYWHEVWCDQGTERQVINSTFDIATWQRSI